eukprot:TRINITY_DN2535_c0_g4_i1.p1 TRINITY_DN2535_c0_g4~~TRINITY_DN2535_c0_g4_i1.p1  ORF type:complete len:1066 (+),score=150.50 TRINITY_DN2535_c0_g4_i1:365-3199(+)
MISTPPPRTLYADINALEDDDWGLPAANPCVSSVMSCAPWAETCSWTLPAPGAQYSGTVDCAEPLGRTKVWISWRIDTHSPTSAPTVAPSRGPTAPTRSPTAPSAAPSTRPSGTPTARPSVSPLPPTQQPSVSPSLAPSTSPPSGAPTPHPSRAPQLLPSLVPSVPVSGPTAAPARPATGPPAARQHPPSGAPSPVPQSPGAPSPVPQSPGPCWHPSAVPPAPAGVSLAPVTAPEPQLPPPPQPLPPPQPPSAGDPPQREDGQKAAQLGAVAGVFGGFAGGGAAQGAAAGRLAVVAGLSCEVEDVDLSAGEPLDLEFHPIGNALGSSRQRYFLGAIVMNPLIVAGMGVALCLGAATQRLVAFGTAMPVPSWIDAMGNFRAPGLCFLPLFFLMQGETLAAANLAFFRDRAGPAYAAGGTAALCLCTAVPGLLWRVMLRAEVLDTIAVTVADPRLSDTAHDAVTSAGVRTGRQLSGWRRSAYRFAYGDTIWVNTPQRSEARTVQCFGVVFESYREGLQGFVCFEMGSAIALSLLAAWKPPGTGAECNMRNVIILVLFATVALAQCTYQPYRAPLDNVLALLIHLANLSAVTLIFVGIIQDAPNLQAHAGRLMMLSAVMLTIKAAWDLLFYCLDMRMGRRRGALEAAANVSDLGRWRAKEAPDIAAKPARPRSGRRPTLADDLSGPVLFTDELSGSVQEMAPVPGVPATPEGTSGRSERHRLRAKRPQPVSVPRVQSSTWALDSDVGDTNLGLLDSERLSPDVHLDRAESEGGLAARPSVTMPSGCLPERHSPDSPSERMPKRQHGPVNSGPSVTSATNSTGSGAYRLYGSAIYPRACSNTTNSSFAAQSTVLGDSCRLISPAGSVSVPRRRPPAGSLLLSKQAQGGVRGLISPTSTLGDTPFPGAPPLLSLSLCGAPQHLAAAASGEMATPSRESVARGDSAHPEL